MTMFVVQITRVETVAFEIDASDAADAANRFMGDGEEIASEITSTSIDSVEEGTAEEILG